jgi:hypothetical protein
VVGVRTGAADARGDGGHQLGLHALHETLEAAEFQHVHGGRADLAVVADVDVHLGVTLDARDRIDG